MPMIAQDLDLQHRRTFKDRWTRAQKLSQQEIDKRRRTETMQQLTAKMPKGVLNSAVDNDVMVILKKAA